MCFIRDFLLSSFFLIACLSPLQATPTLELKRARVIYAQTALKQEPGSLDCGYYAFYHAQMPNLGMASRDDFTSLLTQWKDHLHGETNLSSLHFEQLALEEWKTALKKLELDEDIAPLVKESLGNPRELALLIGDENATAILKSQVANISYMDSLHYVNSLLEGQALTEDLIGRIQRLHEQHIPQSIVVNTGSEGDAQAHWITIRIVPILAADSSPSMAIIVYDSMGSAMNPLHQLIVKSMERIFIRTAPEQLTHIMQAAHELNLIRLYIRRAASHSQERLELLKDTLWDVFKEKPALAPMKNICLAAYQQREIDTLTYALQEIIQQFPSLNVFQRALIEEARTLHPQSLVHIACQKWKALKQRFNEHFIDWMLQKVKLSPEDRLALSLWESREEHGGAMDPQSPRVQEALKRLRQLDRNGALVALD